MILRVSPSMEMNSLTRRPTASPLHRFTSRRNGESVTPLMGRKQARIHVNRANVESRNTHGSAVYRSRASGSRFAHMGAQNPRGLVTGTRMEVHCRREGTQPDARRARQ